MMTGISFLALAGIGDIPLLYWCFVPTFIVENHSAPMMVAIQGGGLAIVALIAVWPLLKRKAEWRWRRLLVLLGYPVVVFGSNVLGLVTGKM